MGEAADMRGRAVDLGYQLTSGGDTHWGPGRRNLEYGQNPLVIALHAAEATYAVLPLH